jgi:hypothetical protein
MPLNFQDAITVTRKLGLRYLWIDSLCIIQNDGEDWKGEATKMGHVYASAYLTIAATCSASTHEGFLHRSKPDVIKMPYQSSDDPSITGEFYLHSRPGRNSTDIASETWNRRGWTFQERHLSARVLHFCRRRLLFECRGADWAEDNQYPHPNQQATWLTTDPAHPKRGIFEDFRDERDRTYNQWYDMVRRYTEREFTYADDLVPAVQGLINEMKTVVDDECCWGIWEGNFERGLLWGRSEFIADRPSFTKPEKSRAPSWSWFSVNGGVTWTRAGYSPKTILSLKVLGIDGWQLEVRGKVRRLHLALDKAWKEWPLLLYYDDVGVGQGMLDVETSDILQRDLWLLEVESDNTAARRSSGARRLAGLLLERCKDFEDTFSRVGYALRYEDSKIFDDVELSTIVLV